MARELTPGTRELMLSHAVYAAAKSSKRIAEIYQSGKFEVNLTKQLTPITIADRESHDIIKDTLLQTRIPMLSEQGRHVHYDERQAWQHIWLVDPLDGTKEFVQRNTEFAVNVALIENKHPLLGVIILPATGQLFFSLSGQGAYRVDQFDFHSDLQACDLDRLMAGAKRLPVQELPAQYTVCTSRLNTDPKIHSYLARVREKYPDLTTMPKSSSLKMCILAEGKANLYPRIAPSSEWDIAAGHALVEEAGLEVLNLKDFTPVSYNKPRLENTPFVMRWVGDGRIPKL